MNLNCVDFLNDIVFFFPVDVQLFVVITGFSYWSVWGESLQGLDL